MTAPTQQTPTTPIDPATEVGLLALTVADLERSVAFYTEALGLAVLERDDARATLGVAGTPLLLLDEQPGARPWPRGGRSYTGLYHFAILVPTRADLGRWLMMIAFGAMFGSTVMARLSLFIGRLWYLFAEWIHLIPQK